MPASGKMELPWGYLPHSHVSMNFLQNRIRRLFTDQFVPTTDIIGWITIETSRVIVGKVDVQTGCSSLGGSMRLRLKRKKKTRTSIASSPLPTRRGCFLFEYPRRRPNVPSPPSHPSNLFYIVFCCLIPWVGNSTWRNQTLHGYPVMTYVLVTSPLWVATVTKFDWLSWCLEYRQTQPTVPLLKISGWDHHFCVNSKCFFQIRKNCSW